MQTGLLVVLVGFTGLLAGYFLRELKEMVRRIEAAVRLLYVRQHQEDQKAKKMGYAEPMSMQEYLDMEEEAKIEALNR